MSQFPRGAAFKPFTAAVEKALEERYGPEWRDLPKPGGLRLEVHPLLYRAVFSDPDGYMVTGNELRDRLQVPLKVTSEMPAATWRLVIITEDELGRGHL